jgi:hypothetical protein
MYGSASTWLFNVVRELGALRGRVVSDFVSDGTRLPANVAPDAIHVLKTHEIGNVAVLDWLSRFSTRLVVTIRDPRDAVGSLMLYHGYDFARALDYVDRAARLCARYAADERALLLSYESRFFEQVGTVARVDAHLGWTTDAAARDAIFGGLRRAAVDAYIARLPALPGVLQDRASGDMLDPRTHWHTHHAGRSGEVGRWKRQLSAEQARLVERRVEGCFRFDRG